MLKKVFGEKLENIGHFFYSDEYEIVCNPTEKDEELLWLSYEECIEGFYHPHHRWAVECIWNNYIQRGIDNLFFGISQIV